MQICTACGADGLDDALTSCPACQQAWALTDPTPPRPAPVRSWQLVWLLGTTGATALLLVGVLALRAPRQAQLRPPVELSLVPAASRLAPFVQVPTVSPAPEAPVAVEAPALPLPLEALQGPHASLAAFCRAFDRKMDVQMKRAEQEGHYLTAERGPYCRVKGEQALEGAGPLRRLAFLSTDTVRGQEDLVALQIGKRWWLQKTALAHSPPTPGCQGTNEWMAERRATVHRLPSGGALVEVRYVVEDDFNSGGMEGPEPLNVKSHVVLCGAAGGAGACTGPMQVHRATRISSPEEQARPLPPRIVPPEALIAVLDGDRLRVPGLEKGSAVPVSRLYEVRPLHH